MKAFILIMLCLFHIGGVSNAQTILQPKWTTGHIGEGVEYNNDGTRVLTWSTAGATIWNINDGTANTVTEWLRTSRFSCCVSNDLSLFVLAHLNVRGFTNISVWDVDTKNKIDSFDISAEDYCHLSINYLNNKLLVGFGKGNVILRDIKEKSMIYNNIIKTDDYVSAVRFSGKTNNFVIVGSKGVTKIVNGENFDISTSLTASNTFSLNPHFNRDGTYVLIENWGEKGNPPYHVLLNTHDGSRVELPKEIEENRFNPIFEFSDDGSLIASITLDNKDSNRVRVWDIKSRELIYSITFEYRYGHSMDTRLNGTGDKIIITGGSGVGDVYNLKTGKFLKLNNNHYAAHSAIFLGSSDKFLTIGQSDEKIIVRNIDDGMMVSYFTGTSNNSYASWGLTPDEKKIYIGSQNGPVKILDASNGKLHRFLDMPDNKTLSAAFSEGGETLVTSSTDMNVRKWDVQTGILKSEFISDYSPKLPLYSSSEKFSYLFLDEPNNILAVAYRYETNIHDATTGDMLHKVRGNFIENDTAYLGYTEYVYITKEKKLILGGTENNVKIWSAESGTLLDSILDVGVYPNSDIAYNKDENIFTFVNGLGHVYKYDLKTGNIVRIFTIKGYWDTIFNVSIDVDNDNKVLAVSANNKICLIDWNSGIEIWQDTFPLTRIKEISFSKNGKMLAVGLEGGVIHVLNTESAKRLYTLRGHVDWISGMKFCENDNALIAISKNNVVKKWEFVTTHMDENSIENRNIARISLKNPVYNELVVFLDTNLHSQFEYNIINIYGQKLDSGNMNSGSMSHTLDTTGLSSGMYIFTTEINGKRVQEKFVVVR